MKRIMLLCLILLGCGEAPPETYAATRTALSCSQSDVSNEITAAAEGDIVVIPVSECTWATPVTLLESKGITLKGAGTCTGSPCTWSGGPTIHGTVDIVPGTGKTYRVTGISFDYVSTTSNQIRVRKLNDISDTSGSHSVRIDNNRFNSRITLDCYCWGVVDHNEWTTAGRMYLGAGADATCPTTTSSCSGYSTIFVFDRSYDTAIGDGGYRSYKRLLDIGSGEAWYIENNYFHGWKTPQTGFAVADSRSGGRQVFRHNDVENLTWVVHDARTGGERGTRKYEVYSNNFVYKTTSTGLLASISSSFLNFGSGSGYIYSNRFQASAFTVGVFTMQNWRSRGNILSPPFTGSNVDPWWKNANGVENSDSTFCLKGPAHNTQFSPANCNAPYGSPAVEMDGVGLLYSSSPASCGLDCGYPARDQIGAGLTDDTTGAQTIEPLYFSDNYYCTGAGSGCNPEPPGSGGTGTYATPLVSTIRGSANECAFPTCIGSDKHIVDGRDYYSNTAYPAYSAYTYPHPIVTADGPPPPEPDTPSGLALGGPVTSTSVTLIWPASTDAAVIGYHIYKSTTPGGEGAIVGTRTLAAAPTSHTPMTRFIYRSAIPCTCYFTIRAFNAQDVQSDASNEVSATLTGIARTPRP